MFFKLDSAEQCSKCQYVDRKKIKRNSNSMVEYIYDISPIVPPCWKVIFYIKLLKTLSILEAKETVYFVSLRPREDRKALCGSLLGSHPFTNTLVGSGAVFVSL